MSNPLKKHYENLHTETVKLLLKRVKEGTATASDLGVARQLLRDNGIDITAANRKAPLHALAEALPFEAPEEDAETG